MSKDVLAALDRQLADLRQQIEGLERLREVIVANPRAAEALVVALDVGRSWNGKSTEPASVEVILRPKRTQTGAGATRRGPIARMNFKAIVAFLRASNGQPKTTKEISEATGLNRVAVAQVLYKTHSDFFERSRHPESNLTKLWAIKKDKEAEAKAEAEKTSQ